VQKFKVITGKARPVGRAASFGVNGKAFWVRSKA